MTRTGVLLVVSGPSGSGKSTLCRAIARDGEAHFSVSCTTRPPRQGEVNGRDYHFLDREAFEADVAAGSFLEHADVHEHRYGTLKSEVCSFLERGQDVVMDIDVQGAAQIRANDDKIIVRSMVDVFVMPATEEELRDRLAGRGTDSEETIALRMKNALEEMRHWRDYTYCLVSGDRQSDDNRFRALLAAERLRVSRLREE